VRYKKKIEIFKNINRNFNFRFKMTALNNIIKRAMSLMKAHVQYSQNLAIEFSHLIKDYELLIESPAEIVPAVQELDLETVCTVLKIT